MNSNAYKVCILTAGIGSRLGSFSESMNKGILPINNKAAISYIIEKFPIDCEIIIAVGYKKDNVIDYLTLAYPERSFTFVEVDKYTGPGSGPGYSLLACKDYLQSPFIFCASDTIVLEDVPLPSENWIGIAPVHETEQYCTVKIKNNLVTQLDDKIKTDNKFAFIGLAGIHDYKQFFLALEQNQELRNNELQMVVGFHGLLERKLVPIGFTWFDTGSSINYIETNKHFSGGEKKFDFSKGDEFLYFVNDRVIKFFADETIVGKRHYRATHTLSGLCPEVEKHKNNFYSYRMVPGQTMYNMLSVKLLAEFLSWSKTHLWRRSELAPEQKRDFFKACQDFYYTKTKKRLEMFHEKTGITEEPRCINGLNTPSTPELLERVDWNRIADGIPSNFHGDLQFDNILVKRDSGPGEHKFLLLDWRHDFGGQMDIGDLYYDLAKLYGGMIISYPLIKEGMFFCDMNADNVYYHYFLKSDVVEAREYYEHFLISEGFDLGKIKILTSLIFLNMAPLHHSPFDVLLHSFGRSMLAKTLGKTFET